jgi:hypothetical protein
MPRNAILFGLALVALGCLAYWGTPVSNESEPSAQTAPADTATETKPAAKRSLTALIPAGFGVLLAIAGVVGLNPAQRKNAMHAAAGVAVLGFVLGGGRFVSKLPALFGGGEGVNQRAIVYTGLLGAVCLIYVIMSVQSFVAARKSGAAKNTG